MKGLEDQLLGIVIQKEKSVRIKIYIDMKFFE
jgi:hypothetical protein